MKYKVIDNFLDEEYFDSLVTLFTKMREDNTAWFFQSNIVYPKNHKKWKEENKLFYMTHTLYNQNAPMSPLYQNIIPLLEKLGTRCLIRVKSNLFPNTHILHEHPMHVDYTYPHSGALLSLNTCDGYTKLKDGTKIDSVANRVLLFDSSEEHCSTTTTNNSPRINININYIQEQFHEQI